MAKRKIPDNETPEEARIRQICDYIANTADRSEKTSWNRKMDNMVKLMSQLGPIEEEILDLQAKKIPIFDEIQELRGLMVKECVHPYEYLSVGDDFVECKFCGKKVNLPNAYKEDA
jgi:hypothetical protein